MPRLIESMTPREALIIAVRAGISEATYRSAFQRPPTDEQCVALVPDEARRALLEHDDRMNKATLRLGFETGKAEAYAKAAAIAREMAAVRTSDYTAECLRVAEAIEAAAALAKIVGENDA